MNKKSAYINTLSKEPSIHGRDGLPVCFSAGQGANEYVWSSCYRTNYQNNRSYNDRYKEPCDDFDHKRFSTINVQGPDPWGLVLLSFFYPVNSLFDFFLHSPKVYENFGVTTHLLQPRQVSCVPEMPE